LGKNTGNQRSGPGGGCLGLGGRRGLDGWNWVQPTKKGHPVGGPPPTLAGRPERVGGNPKAPVTWGRPGGCCPNSGAGGDTSPPVYGGPSRKARRGKRGGGGLVCSC